MRNQNYQNIFPLPPLAIADFITVKASDYEKTGSVSLLSNDVARSGAFLTSSITISGSYNQLDIIRLTGSFSQSAAMYSDVFIPTGSNIPYLPITSSNWKFFTPGTYDAYYTVSSTGSFGVLESNKALIRFNVGNPDCEFTLNQLVKTLEKITGKELEVKYLPGTENDPKCRKPITH